MLEDGRLTDGQGRTVDFTNTVLIMTSNLKGEPMDYFKPEFVNRIDEIVRFKALTEEDLAVIVGIQLDRLRSRLAERRLSRVVTPKRSSGGPRRLRPDYGARPLRRVLQRSIEDPLALGLLEGRYLDGATVTSGGQRPDGDARAEHAGLGLGRLVSSTRRLLGQWTRKCSSRPR